MREEEFDRILRWTDEDEGTLIRYFRMSVQILREILDTPASHELKVKVRNIVRRINRDIINAENQLRR